MGYPILPVTDVVAYLRTMEEAIVAALAEEGIEAGPREGLTGVWVQDRKIGSIGVHVSRGVTTHGFAINVDNDLQPFEWVVPCGLDGVRMTSITKETGQGEHMACFRRRMALAFCQAFGYRQRLVTPERLEARADTLSGVSERIHVTRSRANPGGMDVRRVLGEEVQPFRGRKPPWFKVPPPGGPKYRELTEMIKSEGLHTVCQEAACPNVGECWERGTATFMILGDTCTRRCGFCNVKTGKPTWNDPLEPARVAR